MSEGSRAHGKTMIRFAKEERQPRTGTLPRNTTWLIADTHRRPAESANARDFSPREHARLNASSYKTSGIPSEPLNFPADSHVEPRIVRHFDGLDTTLEQLAQRVFLLTSKRLPNFSSFVWYQPLRCPG